MIDKKQLAALVLKERRLGRNPVRVLAAAISELDVGQGDVWPGGVPQNYGARASDLERKPPVELATEKMLAYLDSLIWDEIVLRAFGGAGPGAEERARFMRAAHEVMDENPNLTEGLYSGFNEWGGRKVSALAREWGPDLRKILWTDSYKERRVLQVEQVLYGIAVMVAREAIVRIGGQ